MPPQAAKKTPLSIDDYLAGERDAETRHDYLDGEVYAMSGASRRHALIVTAMTIALGPLARQRRCQLFTNDVKLRLEIAGATFFYYPDLMIACDPQDSDPYYLTRPRLVAEVLSPGAERIDRREKLLSTISLPSVQEVLLVAQDQPQLELHRRANGWKAERCDQGSLHLDSLDDELAVEQVYADVDWAQS